MDLKAKFKTPIYNPNHPHYEGYVIREIEDGIGIAIPAGLFDSEIEELIEQIKSL